MYYKEKFVKKEIYKEKFVMLAARDLSNGGAAYSVGSTALPFLWTLNWGGKQQQKLQKLGKVSKKKSVLFRTLS